MKQTLTYLGAALFLSLVFPLPQARAEDYYIAMHAVYCQTEADVVEMADTRPGQLLQDLMVKKVISGRCTPPSDVNKKMAYILEKFSPARKSPYYCFKEETSKDEFSDNFSCVLGKFVTSVKQQVSYRTGDYMITAKADNFYNVECAEGGTVTVEKREDQFYRLTNAFQLSMPRPYAQPIPSGRDLDRAIRGGCKGVDYLVEK